MQKKTICKIASGLHLYIPPKFNKFNYHRTDKRGSRKEEREGTGPLKNRNKTHTVGVESG